MLKVAYRAFSLTWPASMQIYGNKKEVLHKKRVQLPQDLFGTTIWPPTSWQNALLIHNCYLQASALKRGYVQGLWNENNFLFSCKRKSFSLASFWKWRLFGTRKWPLNPPCWYQDRSAVDWCFLGHYLKKKWYQYTSQLWHAFFLRKA